MSLQAYEMVDSMSGSVTNDSESGEQHVVRRRYVIGQCEGFNDVVSQMDLYAPRYAVDGTGSYWVRRNLSVNGLGHKWFDCTAEYETLVIREEGGDENPESGSPQSGSLAWDTSGYTERKYQARGERRYPADETDFEQAINVNGSTIEGIDAVVPGMRYSETWIFPAAAAFNEDYLGAVHRLTGTVNLAKFRAFDAGEALFMGARCQWSGDQPFCQITFDFECRPNVPQVYVKGIAEFSMLGWEYVWIRYDDKVADDTLVRYPVAAYVNTIYEQKSWTPLLITAEEVGKPKQPRVPANSGPPKLQANWWQAQGATP